MSKNRGGGNCHNVFKKIISLKNLFSSWEEFKKEKEKKEDVEKFSMNLEDNVFKLHRKLKNGDYRHSNYTSFHIKDPKLRHIHKAEVKDRVLHYAVVKILNPLFERQFIFDSYSSRKNKGTHKAVKRFRNFAWKLSQNNTKTVFVLKCDIKKFFDSVDHDILLEIIRRSVEDKKSLDLLENIIGSFQNQKNKGIPLGNLTSQLFSNIYLNELDQFVKRKLRVKYYIRYADDFVVLSTDKSYLEDLILRIREFLKKNLKLELHPQKVSIRRWNQGIDFLGYVSFPQHFVLRTKTKKRVFKKMIKKRKELERGLIDEKSFNQMLQSYFGILKHCRGCGIMKNINNIRR